MTPDDPRHGRGRAGYDAHRKDGEDACQACRDAAARYQRGLDWDLLNGRSRRIPAVGTLRRLRALVALGWTMAQLAVALGSERTNVSRMLVGRPPAWVYASTAAQVAELFESWSMTVPPNTAYASRARNLARREGWARPLDWQDIDDPTEDPTQTATADLELRRWVDWWASRGFTDVDDAVVERMLASGERTRKLTAAEAESVTRRALARGMSTYDIRHIYGLKPERYVRIKDTEDVA